MSHTALLTTTLYLILISNRGSQIQYTLFLQFIFAFLWIYSCRWMLNIKIFIEYICKISVRNEVLGMRCFMEKASRGTDISRSLNRPWKSCKAFRATEREECIEGSPCLSHQLGEDRRSFVVVVLSAMRELAGSLWHPLCFHSVQILGQENRAK